ncbi:MAG: gas vesicle protein GvpG [Cyanobacteria bacterium J06632_22]
MLLKLLTLPVTGPVEGLAWIGEKVLEQTGAGGSDLEQLQKQLLALQLSFDMGEVPEEEFEEQEEALLLAIEAAQEDD